jgi:hypothetical protein
MKVKIPKSTKTNYHLPSLEPIFELTKERLPHVSCVIPVASLVAAHANTAHRQLLQNKKNGQLQTLT